MKQTIRKRLSPKTGHRIFLAALFLMSGIALYFSLPQDARFKYEYQKGRPWLHATLYAPYNFAIQKSDAEILQEKDSLLRDLVPYYVISTRLAYLIRI